MIDWYYLFSETNAKNVEKAVIESSFFEFLKSIDLNLAITDEPITLSVLWTSSIFASQQNPWHHCSFALFRRTPERLKSLTIIPTLTLIPPWQLLPPLRFYILAQYHNNNLLQNCPRSRTVLVTLLAYYVREGWFNWGFSGKHKLITCATK